jgi:hypothetical protein
MRVLLRNNSSKGSIGIMLAFAGAVALSSAVAIGFTEWRIARSGQESELVSFFSGESAQDEAATTSDSEESANNEEGEAESSSSQASGIGQTIVRSFTNLVSSNPISEVIQGPDFASLFGGAEGGNTIYYDGNDWKVADDLFFGSGNIGIGKSTDSRLAVGGDAEIDGQLRISGPNDRNLVRLDPSGNSGFLSSSGGALFIENTDNIGSGIGIFSNAGAEAEGNMINVKVDNPEFAQAAFYMNYDGTSNAVEIRANTEDRSSNALSLTNFNTLDSGLGVIGYEIDRGSIKVTHNGNGSDANASGISIDLKGDGTAAQGVYVDSTATTGTSGKLLRLRNQSIDRFVVDRYGALIVGATGTDTSITKLGNNANDHFFVGTTGAFRVQRSATDSEAFRVQVVGDSFGRWLGTSDGKLKWSSGSADYDVTLERTAANTLSLSGGTFNAVSAAANSDVMRWTASDGSRLGRIVETSSGHGWFEIDNNAGSPLIVFRADGGNSYVNSGNFGIGTTSFGTSANKVIAIGNGTAPSTSIADGVQLFAEDFDDGGGASSELRVRDEDGNVTTISPHNFSVTPDKNQTDLDWAYYSEKDGRAINVNMAEVVRSVEQLIGKQLLYIADAETGDQLRMLTPEEITFVNSQERNGTLEIAVGETEVEVLFDNAFEEIPVVTVTPLNFIEGAHRISKTKESFTLHLQKPQAKSVEFDWMAVE